MQVVSTAMTHRDYYQEGYDAYEECDNARERAEESTPDNIPPRYRERWEIGWNDAAAADPQNDEVSLRDQGIAFDQVS